MPGALNNLPEFDELVLGDLAIMIKVDSIEELVGRYLPKADLRPVLLRLAPVDRLVTVLVENLENVLYQLPQVMCQILHQNTDDAIID